MIITIDGPAGAGKSSAARGLAKRLGFQFLDTGAMYRAVTLAALEQGVSLDDENAVRRVAESADIRFEGGRTLLDGRDVSDRIRTAEVSAASRAVAANPAVRTRLVELQRRAAAGRNVVTEGRDQGTVVFPDARCKFFLTAHPRERARRRHRDLVAQGEELPLDEVLRQQNDRDRRDAQRAIAPLRPAADAVLIDTTGYTLEETIDLLERYARRAMAAGEPQTRDGRGRMTDEGEP